MSKLAEKSQSFRERRANFSTRILANGRMPLLPKAAVEAELQKVSLKEVLQTLYIEKSKLENQRRKLPQNTEEYLRITETLNRVKGNLGHTQKMLCECKSKEFSEVFQFCAEMFLTHEAFMHIRQMTHELMGKPFKAPNQDSTSKTFPSHAAKSQSDEHLSACAGETTNRKKQ